MAKKLARKRRKGRARITAGAAAQVASSTFRSQARYNKRLVQLLKKMTPGAAAQVLSSEMRTPHKR